MAAGQLLLLGSCCPAKLLAGQQLAAASLLKGCLAWLQAAVQPFVSTRQCFNGARPPARTLSFFLCVHVHAGFESALVQELRVSGTLGTVHLDDFVIPRSEKQSRQGDALLTPLPAAAAAVAA